MNTKGVSEVIGYMLIMAVVMVTPALGPSFGVAPSGT